MTPGPEAPAPGRVLLVGMMGSGKSTVARLLSGALGYGVVDTDQLVEGRAGKTVAEIFDQDGETQFRAAEELAIAEVRDIHGPLVVSVGGGAVLSPVNRRALRELGTVVWLRARPATLAQRVGTGRGRPLLAAGSQGDGPAPPEEVLGQLDAERRFLYSEVSDVIVDVDDLSPLQVAQRLAEALAVIGAGHRPAPPG